MKLTEGGKLERPNLCFLCETTPDHGTKVIDTERYFDGHPFNLQGRRYVCEKCINSMLVHFDLADRATVERAEQETLNAQMILRGLKLRIDVLFKDLRHIAENPTALMEGMDGSVREEVASPTINRKGKDGASSTTGGSPEGGPGTTEGSYSGASLATSPHAK